MDHPNATDLLSHSLQFFKGIGPVRATLLKRLQLETVRDLLLHFPLVHKDRASVTPIAKLMPDVESNIVAQIIDVRGREFPNGKRKVEALLQDKTGAIRGVWWTPWVAERLLPNAWGFFTAKVKLYKERLQFDSPEFEILQEENEEGAPPASELSSATGPSFGRIVPIYSLRPKQRLPSGEEAPEIHLTQNVLRRIVFEALEMGAAERFSNFLPQALAQKLKLMPLAPAIRQFHFPDTLDKAFSARRRLVFEELFTISTGVALRRAEIERHSSAQKLPLLPVIEKRIHARLPFQLTPAQDQVIHEIAADMASSRPMNRLLQGDVGSGKTAVAVAALLLTVAHGGQGTLLAPTEVLAQQHARLLEKMLQGSRVKIGLLRGASTTAERSAFLQQLASGEINIAVGTHALLEPGVTFKSLALVVVDEQHKFGVSQRMKLRAKSRWPHVLVMTATPIPRTLTLTLYGDLDVSRIDQPPPGRGEIVTKWIKEAERAKVYKTISEEAAKGHAAYVVLPRIEEAEDDQGPEEEKGRKGEGETTAGRAAAQSAIRNPQSAIPDAVKGVEKELLRLRKALPKLRIEMLHGRLSSAEKDRVLTLLREGNLDVLVSTQVIEVGIDLPKATVMLIENAEMFGLSALHQLRGRVGRSERASYCFLAGRATTDEATERLETMVKTRDGFEIAEVDFKLRGPGQFFGTQQSGMPELKIADLLRDARILAEARDEAFALVRDDPTLSKPEHAALRERIRQVLGPRLGLIDVG
jgi:ATP-dependent DNA helicase RecG